MQYKKSKDENEKQTKEIQPLKKGCGCFFWAFLIFICSSLLLFFVSYFFQNNNFSKIKDGQCQKRQYEDSLIFSAYLKPDYSLTEKEEEELDIKLGQLIEQGNPPEVKSNMSMEDMEKKMKEELVNKYKVGFLLGDEQGSGDNKLEKINQAKSLMKKLKNNYPEGYFVIAKHILKTDIRKEPFYLFFTGDNRQSANVSIHEFSHAGIDTIMSDCFSRRCYWIEDKFLCIPETSMLPEGKEVFAQMEKTNDFDKKYLQEANQNIFNTLEEIGSYTKSVRINRVFQCLDSSDIQSYSQPENLSRQLYLFSLQLKNIKENHPKLWVEFSKKKGFVFIANRVIEMAKRELDLYDVNASSAEKEIIKENLELFNNNSNYFSDLLKESKILEIKDSDLSENDIKELDILIKYIR